MSRPHAGSLAENSTPNQPREPPVNRGRALTSAGPPPVNLPIPKILTGPDGSSLDRRPSISSSSYGHHRQTSIVHGIQHSRNASFVTSHPGPLSPQILGLSSSGSTSGHYGSDIYTSMLEEIPSMLPSMDSTLTAVNVAQLANTMSSSSDRSLAGSTLSGPARGQLERMHSSKSKHPHSRSQSRAAQPAQAEVKTVGEYALHHLFTAFVLQANIKIDKCAGSPTAPEPQVEQICGPGVDAEFDQLIPALAHVARQKPKPLIDTLMLWRQNLSAEAGAAREALNKATTKPVAVNGTSRRNVGQTGPFGGPSLMNANADGGYMIQSALNDLQLKVIIAERRSTVSIYLLCRAFIEVITISTLPQIGHDLFGKLLDIVFLQLVFQEPETLEQSPLKLANWKIFGQLLGVMSGMHFESVAKRYIDELSGYQNGRHVKDGWQQPYEDKAVLVARSMKHLVLKTTPTASWEQSCSFMQGLANLFANSHGQALKYAYCQLFEDLLVPIAAHANAELNVPKWKHVIETIRPRLLELLAKPKHWLQAFSVTTVLVCASPMEAFCMQWLQLLPSIQTRLKERATRGIALRGLCRLVWRYLYHSVEPPMMTQRRLEEIKALIFQTGKRTYLSTETAIAEPLIQLIRIIGTKYQDFCFRQLIFPLMNADQLMAGREHKVDDLEPEKMVIGIRGFLAVMADLETGEQPPFPITFYNDTALERFETTSMPISPRPMIPVIVKSSSVKEDRLSRPVIVSNFGDIARESYIRFCKILGEITIICDNTFGGQAVLDEKFSGIQTPKTPMTDAFSFSKRDEHIGGIDPKQGFYDLLHVAVQALPRSLSPHIPFNSLINLLCTGTAHVQTNIAASSAQSLKAIARQSHAQQVTIGFARFIFNFDDRYATMSDGGMLGPGHIESTLQLYVELLHIWIDEIKSKTKKASGPTPEDNAKAIRAAGLDLSQVCNHVDEIESYGLFFLCSPSRRVRAVAITVLRLVTEFDTALCTDSMRVIKVLEGNLENVIDVHDEKLTVAERSRLQKGIRESQSQHTLLELCTSDTPHDSKLWFKVFPNLTRISIQICPIAVALTREAICARLFQMQRTVAALADGGRYIPYGYEMQGGKLNGRLAQTCPEAIIEQWKLCLIFACTTLSSAGGGAELQVQGHARKSSKSSQKSIDKMGTAGKLFNMILPLLTAGNEAVRDAVVVGLGSINRGLFRILLEYLQPMVASCNEEAKQRLAMYQRTPSSLRPTRRAADILRTEITHIYKLTAHFLQQTEWDGDDWVLSNLVNFAKDLRLFLNDVEVQNEYDFQLLRTHYCGLIEQLYEGINTTKEPTRWMTFQSRRSTFALMEDWCGYSPNQNQIKQREETMRRSYLDRESYKNASIINARMEIEKRNLRTAALSAMAVLCGGPVRILTDNKTHLQFDLARLLSWIDSIFDDVSDRTHGIGRRALRNLMVHNPEEPLLLDHAVEMCYMARSPKSLESYFEVIREVMSDADSPRPQLHKIIAVCLFLLGNENSTLRTKAVRLLRTLEVRKQNVCKLQDLDISVSDKTIAVYKNAQFDVSKRLAQPYAASASLVFSEFSRYFKDLQPDHQRNLVAAMLPWIHAIDLQVDGDNIPTAATCMLLINLFEITVKCGTTLHNEIQALWQALATGPHAGNVQVILDFIIQLCLERKEQNFVDYSRQIVVYLSGTLAGAKVVEALLLQIEPKAMVLENREPLQIPDEAYDLPYLAKLEDVLPGGNKGHGFSLGQLSLVLLVDLIVAPVDLPAPNITLLLQVVLVLWDNYQGLVQEQAREMLVHMIHELVLSKMDDTAEDSGQPRKQMVEEFIDCVRRSDVQTNWSYEEYNKGSNDEPGLRVPKQMKFVADRILQIFSPLYPELRGDWSKMSLAWATTCSVRHIACRSFQLFRCIFNALQPTMLSDMLARLSNTIAADENEIMIFSMEILATLRTIIDSLSPEDLIQSPQLFWTTCACLNTTHEREFIESLAMLDIVLNKIDLSAPSIIEWLEESRPQKWEGPFDGLSTLVYKGIRSSISLEQSFKLLEKLISLPASSLVGDDRRLAFTLLANLPRYLHSFDLDHKDREILSSAQILSDVAEQQSCFHLSRTLRAFSNVRYRNDKDFLAHAAASLRQAFFPALEYESLVFLLSLLTNSLAWFKIKTMQVLCVVIPDINMDNPEIASKGPDLISPLLRLLQTEFCPQALEVLDNIMTMTATPMDRHHMRMSMVGSHSTRATRKEYEKTVSLYGIPHESGWSIAIPAKQSETTRNNVHAVFYGYASATTTAPPTETPKIELVSEDVHAASYFPDGTAASVNEPRQETLSDLMAKLDSLDEFFDGDNYDSPTAYLASLRSPPGLMRYPSEVPESREDIYDQQTFPLLNKSLGRNISITSFQNGFADNKYPPSREGQNIMTPGAFNMLPLPALLTQPMPRPGMHSRTVTSPALTQHTPPGMLSSPLDLSPDPGHLTDDTVSDEEITMPRLTHAHTAGPTFALDNMQTHPLSAGGNANASFPGMGEVVKPGGGRFRSGIRRLTGGSTDVKDVQRIRDQIHSPKVPRVPNMYLQGARAPRSSDP